MKYLNILRITVLFLALSWGYAAANAPAPETENNSATQTEEQTPITDRGDAQTLPPLQNELPSIQNNLRDAQDDPSVEFTEDKRLMPPWADAPAISTEGLELPPWFGEKLKFKISWAFITAGEAELNFDKAIEEDGVKAYQIEALAKSYSVIDAVFKVRDINKSWISAEGKRSLGYWQSVREGNYKRDEWVRFNYNDNSFNTYKQDKRGHITAWDNNFKGTSVFDMLSSLYYVRTLRLPLKTTVFFDIVNRNRQYPLKVVVLRKETVKVKAGKFDCIVVEPMISGEGIFVSKGKSLKVWLTDDKYKMPVKMSVDVFIGSVSAELFEYSRGQEQQ